MAELKHDTLVGAVLPIKSDIQDKSISGPPREPAERAGGYLGQQYTGGPRLTWLTHNNPLPP